MTAQFPTTCIYAGKGYVLGEASGGALFNPLDFDLRPIPSCTACWSGYLCHYAIVEKQLILQHLDINLTTPPIHSVEPITIPPTINGCLPVSGQDASGGLGVFSHHYQNVDLAIPFTGEIILCDGFIREYYVHMGWQPVWTYRTVIALTMVDGFVSSVEDRSDTMAAFRETRKAERTGRS